MHMQIFYMADSVIKAWKCTKQTNKHMNNISAGVYA